MIALNRQNSAAVNEWFVGLKPTEGSSQGSLGALSARRFK
jgi:hypothetical protein